MKYTFKVKCIDVEVGGKNVAVLNRADAKEMDVTSMDRVSISVNGKELAALVDLTETYVAPGEIGAFYEVFSALKLRDGQKVIASPIEKPPSVSLIKKKMDGQRLSADEISMVISDLMHENLSEVELTAFLSAMYMRGLDTDETVALTRAIVNSGNQLRLARKPIMDKHCIGGIPGNRTTMLVVPILAAAGLTIPKTSSRAITSPAGTADTMEVLAPVSISADEIIEIVNRTNGCIVWGGAVGLAAADDKLIKIRQPLKIDPEGAMLASILAKKKAVGATHVLIDLPIGKGAKLSMRDEAEALAAKFLDLGKRLGMHIHCIVTPGDHPVGNAIGPGLEAKQTLEILMGKEVGYELKEKSVTMAGIMLELGGVAKKDEGAAVAQRIIDSGDALKKFLEIIEAQGGNPRVRPEDIPIGDKTLTIKSDESGRIFFIDNRVISSIARTAGAPVDVGAGIELHVEKGDKIAKGQDLMTIHAESERKLDAAKEVFDKQNPIELAKVVLETYTGEKPYVHELKS